MILKVREVRDEGRPKWETRSERKEKREKEKEIWIGCDMIWH